METSVRCSSKVMRDGVELILILVSLRMKTVFNDDIEIDLTMTWQKI